MTREEWKARAATRYAERLGVTGDEAGRLAQELYDGQDGEFCEHANYDPEGCADEDIAERSCGEEDDEEMDDATRYAALGCM